MAAQLEISETLSGFSAPSALIPGEDSGIAPFASLEQYFGPDQLYALGYRYFVGDSVGIPQDYLRAQDYFLKAIKRNGGQYSPSEVTLGYMFATGLGVEKDYTKAADFWRKAANKGHPNAQHNFAMLYDMGKGVEQSDERATQWWLKAADLGHEVAMFNLGLRYTNGIGVEKDLLAAAGWYVMASNRGHIESQANLAYALLVGLGIPKDEPTAIRLLQNASEHGSQQAQSYLASCYLGGTGVEQDSSKAVFWFNKASEQGHVDSQLKLAAIFLEGAEGIEKSPDIAAKYYHLAAENGSAIAQHNLAVLYETGLGVEKNIQTANEWQEMATKSGISDIPDPDDISDNHSQKRHKWVTIPYGNDTISESTNEKEAIETATSSVAAQAPNYLTDDVTNETILEKDALATLFSKANSIAATLPRGRPSRKSGYEKPIDASVRIDPKTYEWLSRKSPEPRRFIASLLSALRQADEGSDGPNAP
ncbi:MAG: hypothetical protein DHS20C05_06730 [Hyphococcus sp.]|nr:MAG: hypothetical protein DHS20C05_06730 [Marinicaulis sp.]